MVISVTARGCNADLKQNRMVRFDCKEICLQQQNKVRDNIAQKLTQMFTHGSHSTQMCHATHLLD